MIQCISFSGIEYISKHISQNRYTVWGKRLSENCFQLCNSATVIHVSMVSLQNFTFNHAFNFSGVLKLLTASPHNLYFFLQVILMFRVLIFCSSWISCKNKNSCFCRNCCRYSKDKILHTFNLKTTYRKNKRSYKRVVSILDSSLIRSSS